MPRFSLFQNFKISLDAVEGGYRIQFLNGDESALHKEERPGEPWASTQIQAELGNKLYTALPEDQQERHSQDWVKKQVKETLQEVGQSLNDDEELQQSLQSPVVQKILTATDSVDIYPGDPTRYVVSLRGREIEFTPSELNGGPGVLKNAWLNKFPTDRIKLNGEEWDKIAESWLNRAEMHEAEKATEASLLVEGLLSWLSGSRIKVYDSKEALLEEKHHAWFDTEGEKLKDAEPPAVFVGAEAILDYLKREGENRGDAGELAKDLRREGHLLEPSRRFYVEGHRVRAWPFCPGSINISEEEVSVYKDSEPMEVET